MADNPATEQAAGPGATVIRLHRRAPSALVERVRAISAGVQAPTPARDASTVVLLRDAPGGGQVEAYLLRRSSTMAFASGMHVFPGGRVDPVDSDGQLPWTGPDVAELAPVLGADPNLAGGLVCAAVRETFEECGVLLASPLAATDPDEPLDLGETCWVAERKALEARETHLTEMLNRRGLALRADLLRPWARWVTPDAEPRRYDTRFFVAALPAGQQPGAASSEADQMFWISPAAAIRRHEAGEMRMLPPTVFTLAELCAYATVADVLEAARLRDLAPVIPKILISGEEAHILIPHDTPHIASSPAIPNALTPSAPNSRAPNPSAPNSSAPDGS